MGFPGFASRLSALGTWRLCARNDETRPIGWGGSPEERAVGWPGQGIFLRHCCIGPLPALG